MLFKGGIPEISVFDVNEGGEKAEMLSLKRGSDTQKRSRLSNLKLSKLIGESKLYYLYI